MKPAELSCDKCGLSWFPDDPARAEALAACPGCGAVVAVAMFPAFGRAAVVVAAQPVVTAAEAACFFHPTQRAAVACDQCGCFLCALCDLELRGRHLCPNCLEAADREGREASLERGRTRHDHVVWAILGFTLLLGCGLLAPVTAPLTLGYIAWAWRKPPSLVERSRLRMGLAVPVAVGGLGLGVFMWLSMFK